MGNKHSIWVRQHSRSSPAARNVLYALASAASDDENEAYPSISTLEEWTGLSRRTVFRALEELEELGEITCNEKKGRATHYFLTMIEPVSPRYQCHRDTSAKNLADPCQIRHQLVPNKTSTSATVTPRKLKKDHEREKTDLSMHLAVDFTAQTAKTRTIDDEAYKRQTAAWVEPVEAQAARALWDKCKEALKLELASSTYYTWLHNTTVIAGDETHLVILASNTYARDWLENRLLKVVQRTLKSVTGHDVTVTFEAEGGEVQTIPSAAPVTVVHHGASLFPYGGH